MMNAEEPGHVELSARVCKAPPIVTVQQGPHILDKICEEPEMESQTITVTSCPPPTISTTPPYEPDGEKSVCKLERKRSSIRRKRVLAAVTADDNKPVHIPLVEYGDRHDVYKQIANRVIRGSDVMSGVRLLQEKLGVLRAICTACGQRIDKRIYREERWRRRIHLKRSFVVITWSFIFLSIFVIVTKLAWICIDKYFRFMKEHIHYMHSST